MGISRRHLALPLPILWLVALGLFGSKPAQASSADETRLEAFRAAQAAADAKALKGLCAPELGYSHSDRHVEDKATFIKNSTAGKSKTLSLEYKDPPIRVVGDAAIVRFHWLSESESIPDELAETRRRVEAAVARVHQTLTFCVRGEPGQVGARGRRSGRLSRHADLTPVLLRAAADFASMGLRKGLRRPCCAC